MACESLSVLQEWSRRSDHDYEQRSRDPYAAHERGHSPSLSDLGDGRGLQGDGEGFQQIVDAGSSSDAEQDGRRHSTTQPIAVPYHDSNGARLQQFQHRKFMAEALGESGHYFVQPQPAQPASSIQFASRVKCEDGETPGLGERLPRPTGLRVRTRSRGQSVLDEMASQIASAKDGQPQPPLSRQERSAVGQISSMAGSVPEEAVEPLPPLVDESNKGSSPPIEDVPTPKEDAPAVYGSPAALSPASAWPSSSSPASTSSSWYARKYGNMSRPGSFRRGSRRSNVTSVGESPASAFLRQYSMSSNSPLQQPDSQGSEVGEYILGRELGSGGFSTVREAFSVSSSSTNATMAVKIVRQRVRDKSEAENEALQKQFEHELEIWRDMNHSNMLKLCDVRSTDFATFAFMPLMNGGTLWEAVKSTKGQGLKLSTARTYAAQIAEALRYLHEDLHIVHRDVKLENCLLHLPPASFDNPSDDNDGDAFFGQRQPRVVLADFGLAQYLFNSSPVESPRLESPNGVKSHGNVATGDESGPAGSLHYAAPELLNVKKQPPLSFKLDTWAFGVLLYTMVVGRLPFSHSFTPKLVEAIKGADYDRELLHTRVKAASAANGAGGSGGVPQGGKWLKAEHECGLRMMTPPPSSSPSALSATSPHSPHARLPLEARHILGNEQWARSCHTIIETEGVPSGDLGVLVNGCLQTKSDERWGIRQVYEAEWFAGEIERD